MVSLKIATVEEKVSKEQGFDSIKPGMVYRSLYPQKLTFNIYKTIAKNHLSLNTY
jgi:hypothetical protein